MQEAQWMAHAQFDRAYSERADAIVATVVQLPSPPESTMRLLALASRREADMSEILSVIERSPSLAAETLRLVNSAAVGLARTVQSVRSAAILLGPHQIRSLAVAASLAPVLKGLSNQFEYAVAVATQAQNYASDPEEAEQAFTAGLLADVGKLVMVSAEDPAVLAWRTQHGICMADADLDAERLNFGSDHAYLGEALARRWGLSPKLMEAIRWHHGVPDNVAGSVAPIVAAAVIAVDQAEARI
jgi:HD-like signal output (HDOD) protein